VSTSKATVTSYQCDAGGCVAEQLSPDDALPRGWLSYVTHDAEIGDTVLHFSSENCLAAWLDSFINGIKRGGSDILEYSLGEVLCLEPTPHTPPFVNGAPLEREPTALQRRQEREAARL
jgi:hypothetical protein